MSEAPTERRRVRDPNPDLTAPQLVVEVEYEVKVQQYVDLIGHYSRLSEREQKWFARYVAENESQGYGDDEFVLNFLLPEDDDLHDVGEVPYGEGAADHAWVEVDGMDTEVRVALRTGYRERIYGREEGRFSQEDFDYLLDHVPWLKAFFVARRQERELEPEEIARIPGSNDIPLEGT